MIAKVWKAVSDDPLLNLLRPTRTRWRRLTF